MRIERHHEIFKRTAHDYTMEEAMEEFNVCRETIYEWCKRFRVKVKKKKTPIEIALEGKDHLSSARVSLETGIPVHKIKYHRCKLKSSSL